ncbi:MAG: hypothetical protein ACOY3L_12675 [Pseudomonadota bacterium]
MKRTILAALLISGFATPALAFECPSYMKKIDEALAGNPSISAEQLAEVKQLRAEGEAAHQAGNHKQSVEQLEKAMEILGIED